MNIKSTCKYKLYAYKGATQILRERNGSCTKWNTYICTFVMKRRQ